MKLAYTPQKFKTILHSITKCKVQNFPTAAAYLQNIQEKMDEADLYVTRNEQLTDREQTDMIYKGLSPRIKRGFARMDDTLPIESRLQVIDRLRKTENEIRKETASPGRTTLIGQEKKFCTNHLSKTHNTNDCRLNQKYMTRDNRNKREDRLCIVIEPVEEKTDMTIEVQIGGRKVKALLYTGASVNIMTESLAKHIPTKLERLQQETEIMTMNGVIKTQYNGKTCLKLSQIPHTKYKVEVLITHDAPYNLILGTRFQRETNMEISFKEGQITMDSIII